MNRKWAGPLACSFFFLLFACYAVAQRVDPGAISGRVVLRSTGDPLPDTSVELHAVNGRETYAVQSAEGGAFRFVGIPPGPYVLYAVRSGFLRAEYGRRRASDPQFALTVGSLPAWSGIELAMVPAAAIDGWVTDPQGQPLPAAVVRAFAKTYVDGHSALRLVQTVTTDDLGNYRLFSLQPGRYYVGVGAASPWFYPEAADIRQAEPIDLAAGATAAGIHVIAHENPERHVRGIVNFRGAQAHVQLTAQIPVLNAGPASAEADPPGGAFDISPVSPGAYVLTAVSGADAVQLPVEIGAADLNDVRITITFPVELPVQVSAGPAGRVGVTPSDMAFKLQMDPPVSGVPGTVYTPDRDGRFTIRVAPGRYRIVGESRRADAYLESARLNGSDVLNDGLRVDADLGAVLEIAIGATPGALEGSVDTIRQQPAANVLVVLAPDALHRQRIDLFKDARTDAFGRFKLENIPPGDYTVFVWEDVEPSAWLAADFMQLHGSGGQTVHVGSGTRQNLQLTAIPPP